MTSSESTCGATMAGDLDKDLPLEGLTRLRHRRLSTHMVGELFSKQWIDSFVPAVVMVSVIGLFMILAPGLFSSANLTDTGRQLGEFGLVSIGMMIVIMGGGIDLSVGSIFALGNLTALALTGIYDLPAPVVLPCVIAVCSLVGLINGILIGYLRLRAFLTTLVTLITVRALVDVLLLKYAVQISASFYDSLTWDFVGQKTVLGIPFSLCVLIVVAIVMHIVLSRTGLGWRIMAVGGSRRSTPVLRSAAPSA